MGNPLDSSQFRRLLDDRLLEVSDQQRKMDDLEAMIPILARQIGSERAWEEFFSVSGVPDIPEFGGKLTSLSVSPGYHKKIEPAEFAGQIVSKRTLIDDKRYSVLDGFASGLMQSANRVREKKLVNIFANITSTAFDFMDSEEGVSLASDSHTTKTPGVGTTSGFDNAGTSAMNKTSIAATRLLMRRFRSDIGERFQMDDSWGIICPDNLADVAEEVNSTPAGLDTAEGNTNPQKGRYKVIPYMRLDDFSTTSWGMVNMTRMKQDLIFLDRTKPEPKNTVDWSTYAFQQAIYARFAAGFVDWRWVFWNTV